MGEIVEVSTKQVIVMRTDLGMRRGKQIAQGAHASLGIFTQNMIIKGGGNLFLGTFAFGEYAKQWFESSFAKICLRCDSEEELLTLYEQAKNAGISCILITDNGNTEFHGVPTNTCIAIGPDKSEYIDKITGHLKLL